MSAATTLGAVGVVAACGGKPDPTTSLLEPVSLEFESLASKLVAENAKLLYLRDGKVLRVLAEDGVSYGVKDGAMVKAEAESVVFANHVPDKGVGFAIAPGNGWFLGEKTVARLGIVGGQPKVFSAESKGRHRVVFADDARFVAFDEGKLEIYGLKQLQFVRTEIAWPLKDEEPVAGGYGAGTGKYWFATQGDFIYLDEADGTLVTFPIKVTGLEGKVRSWAFALKKEDFEKGRLPKAGAALTDKGLFASNEMKAAATVDAAAGGGDLGGGGGGGDAGGGGGGGGTTTPVALTFDADIKPIAQAHCAGCHSGGVFASLKDALKEADWVDGKVKILERIKKNKGDDGYMPLPHGAEAQYTAERKAKLVSWLENAGTAPVVPPTATQPPVAATQAPVVNQPAPVKVTVVANDLAATALDTGLEKEATNLNNGALVRNVVRLKVGSNLGRATFPFSGASGKYKVEVKAIDEDDGENALRFFSSGAKVGNDVKLDVTPSLTVANGTSVANVERTFVLSTGVNLTNMQDVAFEVERMATAMGNNLGEAGRMVEFIFTPVP